MITESRISARPALVGEHMVPLSVSEEIEAEARAWRMVAEDLANGYREFDNIKFRSGLADFDEMVEFYGIK